MAATDLVLFDTRETAAALGITTRTLARWVKDGRIKPAKASSGYVFTGEEVGRVARLPRPQRGGYRPRRRRPEPQQETLLDAS